MLAGINVTLMDYRPVTHTDLASHFYLREEHVGKNVRKKRFQDIR